MAQARPYVLLVRLLWTVSRFLTGVGLLAVLVRATATAAMMIASGHVIQGVLDGRVEQGWLTVMVAALFLSPISDACVSIVGEAEQGRATPVLASRLAKAVCAPHGIAHLDDPDVRQRVAALQEDVSQQYFKGVAAAWQILGSRLAGLSALVVLMAWSWWIGLLVLVATRLTSRAWQAYSKEIFETLFSDTERRRSQWYRGLLHGAQEAKEVRLFGLLDFALRRFTETWSLTMHAQWRSRGRAMRTVLMYALASVVVYAVALALLGRAAWTGAITTGTLLTTAQALIKIDLLGMLGDIQTYLARQLVMLTSLDRLERELAAQPPPHRMQPLTLARGAASVRLDDVHFSYPTRETETFAGLSLSIEAGSSVAIVGLNGAGKSTLIKLLCGLYPPSAGSVRIDDDDPAADDAVRRRVAVIFQDFVRYHLTLRENVGMALLHEHPERLVGGTEAALHDAVGDEVLRRAQGWERVLSAAYEGGTELSGGQWQRVALARALAAVDAGAGVLVLDEPTAALDVRAEAELFDRFLRVTRGVTTILVSHRLSSVRHVDRIVVLDHGRIVEDGTHEQLMADGGGYAHLFGLQVQRFAAAGGGPA